MSFHLKSKGNLATMEYGAMFSCTKQLVFVYPAIECNCSVILFSLSALCQTFHDRPFKHSFTPYLFHKLVLQSVREIGNSLCHSLIHTCLSSLGADMSVGDKKLRTELDHLLTSIKEAHPSQTHSCR